MVICCHCQQQNVTTRNFSQSGVLASERVRRRPIRFKQLGEFLIAQRASRQWQQAEAAAIAKRRGLKALTRQVLLRLENGQTKSPEPEALRAVAELYTLNYDDLVHRMMVERYGISSDLIRHTGTGQQDSHQSKGESDVPASARIQQLERRVQEYESALHEVQDLANRLVRIASVGEESRPPGRVAPSVRRRDRKAG
jgi:transcriptional regulator with XRE-family HTH domain